MRIRVATVTLLVAGGLIANMPYGANAVPAAGTSLRVGDRLIYAITIELQQHHVKAGAVTQDRTTESSVHGTETFTIYAIGGDGTAYANAEASFRGIDDGRPVDLHTKTAAKVLPDGQLRTKDQTGLGVSDAIGFANTTTQETSRHTLSLGSGWTTAELTPYVHLTMSRKVNGKAAFRGLTAYVLRSIGSGTLVRTTDGKPASGTIAISATSYYDDKDRLLIGEALRTLTVVRQSADESAHDNYSTTMDVVLSSWIHGSVPPSVSPDTGASPQASATPSSVPVPTVYAPTPYPTVTPRLGY